jgi:hypothetical protein
MTEEMELLFKQYIKDNLRLDVQTESVYTGGMDGPLYVDRHCVQLILDDEVISEVGL